MEFLEILVEDPKARVVFSHYDPPWRKGKKDVSKRTFHAAVHTVNFVGVMTTVHFQAEILEQVECLVQLYLDYRKDKPEFSSALLTKASSAELEAFLA